MSTQEANSAQYFTASMATIRAIVSTYWEEPGRALEAVAAYLVLCRSKQAKRRNLTTAGANAIADVLGRPRRTCEEILEDLMHVLVSTDEGDVPAVVPTPNWNRIWADERPLPEKVGTYTTRVLPWHGEQVHLNPKVLDGFNQTQDARRTPLRKLLDGCSPERARLDALLVFLELNANIRLDTHGGVNGNLLNREWEEGSPVRGTATPTHRVGDLYFTWHQCPNRHDREDDHLHVAPALLERVCGSSNPETRQRFVDALRFLRREGLVHERIAVFNQPPEEHERARMQYIALFASSKESAQINRNNGQAAIAHLALNALRRADCEADEVLEECIEQRHDGRPFDAPSTRKPFVAVLCGQRALVRTIFIPDPIAHTADNCSGQEYMNRLNDSWATKLENFARETSDVSA